MCAREGRREDLPRGQPASGMLTRNAREGGPVLGQITAPHFVAGIVLDENYRVVEAAPIVKYMLGWTSTKVGTYCRSKKWNVRKVTT